MIKRIIATAALLVGGLGLTALGVQSAVATQPNPDHKVTLCHRTGSETNPYVVITTDIASDGYVKGGHNEHTVVGNGLGGDIIPAYVYTNKKGVTFVFDGYNLDTVFPNGETGAEILEAGCVLSESESPTPTVTPSESPSDSPSPSTTHTPSPSTHTTPPSSHHSRPSSQRPVRKTAFTGIDGWVWVALGGLTIAGTGALYAARRKSMKGI